MCGIGLISNTKLYLSSLLPRAPKRTRSTLLLTCKIKRRVQRRKRGRKKLGGKIEGVELVNILKLYWENRSIMEENERLKEKALRLRQENTELRSHLLTVRSSS